MSAVPVLLLLLGLLAGGVLAWLLLRGSRAEAEARLRSALQEKDELQERMIAFQVREAELTARMESSKQAAEDARASQERNSQKVAETFQTRLTANDSELREMRDKVGTMAAHAAGVETLLEAERKSSEEKLAFLRDAKVNLAEEEFRLYQKLFEIINPQIIQPDLLVYLHSPVSKLQENIKQKMV